MHAARPSLLATALAVALCACPNPPSEPPDSGLPGDTGVAPQGDTGATPQGDGGAQPSDAMVLGDGGVIPGSFLTVSDGPTYDFGRIAVGATDEHAFTVTNLGTAEAIGLGYTVPAAPYEPGSGSTCQTSLPSGSSCSIVVKFAPTAAGDAFPGELSVTYGPAGSRQEAKVGVTGAASAPAALAFSEASFDFGDEPQGAVVDHTFTLANSGGMAATAMTAAALAAPFSFKGGSYPGTGGTCAASLDPAGSCTVAVTFTAQVFGDHAATLSVGYQSGLGAQKAEAALSAKSHSPAVLAVSDDPTFAFGNVVVGAVAEHAFDVTNTGGADATLMSGQALSLPFAYKGGSYPGTGGTCAATLAATTSCKVVVTFTPTAHAGSAGDLKINYDDGAASQTVTRPMTGTGSNPAALAFSGFDYGQVNVGSTSDHTFTVSNSGEASATGVTASALATGFSFKDGAYPGTGGTCGSAIPAGSCTLVVTFAPARAGTASTVLALAYSDGLAPASASQTLTGTGYVPATLAFGSATYDFGTVAPNVDSSLLLMLSNTGSVAATSLDFDPLVAPFSYKGGTFPGIAGTCGATVAAGTYCILDVVYRPTAVGSSSAVLKVDYQNGSGSGAAASTTLSGTAVGTAFLSITDYPPDYYTDYGMAPDPATFAFLTMGVGETQDHTFSVTNTGAADATSIAGGGLTTPLSFKGGAFPGAGGTCGATLAKGATCTVVAAFAPTAVGDFQSDLTLTYNAGTAKRPLSGTATDKALLVLFDYDIGISMGASFDFGVAGVGVPIEHTFYLGNAGARIAAAISGLALPAPFTYTGGAFPGTGGNCGDTLDPFDGCQISVTFQPAAAGPFSATLDVSYDDGAGAAHVTRDLTGTGTTAALLALMGQGPTANFGVVAVNGRGERDIDVTNVGGATATAIAPRALAAPFKYKDGTYPGTGGTCGATLLSGITCRLVVEYAPTATGESATTLALDYSDGTGAKVAQVALKGTGIATALLVINDDPWGNDGGGFGNDAFDFGVQGAPVQHTFYVRNAGAQTATAISSTLAAPFGFTGGTYPGTGGTCGATLAAGAGCTVVVTFTPTGDATAGTSLTIAYDDGAAAQTAVRAVTGTSTSGANLLILMSEDDGGGGVVDLGTVGAATHGMLTVRNNGAKAASGIKEGAPALSDGFSFYNGAYPGEGGTCGATLAAGATCTLSVGFTPVGEGPHSTTLRLDYQDGNGHDKTATRAFYAYEVDTALLAIIDWPSGDALENQGPRYDFGLVGLPAEHTFYVVNLGAKDASSISVASLGDGFALKTGNLPPDACGSTVAVGGYCAVTVVYTPGTAGMHQATLTLDYQNGSAAAQAKRPMIATATTNALLEIHNCQSCGADDGSFSFGIVGQTTERTIYLFNRGGGTATNLTVGALANGFSLKTADLPQDACGTSLDQGQGCSLTLVFTPSGNGQKTSTLTVSYDNGTGTASVSRDLVATATDRAMLLVYDWSCQNCGGTDWSRPFDFGTTGSPVEHEFMLVNVGALPATSLAGSLPNGYGFKGGTFPGTGGTCAATLPQQSGCTIEVVFTPPAGSNAVFAGNLTVAYDDGFAQVQATRSLTATATALALLRLNDNEGCPDCGNGGSYQVGPVGQPVEHTFWLHNVGGQDATALAAAALSTGFSFKGGTFPGTGGTCTQTLAKGAQCSMVLAFSPTGLPVGSHSTALSVSYGNGSATMSVSVNISVTTTSLALLRVSDWDNCPDCGAWNENPFDFGVIAVGGTTEHTFHLNNVGAQAATGLSVTQFSGTFAFKGGAYPGAGGTCGTSLAAGDSCTLVVTFNPTQGGGVETWLHVSYNDGSTTKTADRWLSGEGTTLGMVQATTCMNGCGWTDRLEFGTTGTVQERTLYLINVGAHDVSSLGTSQLGNGFAFKGTGTWPGQGGTCGATLAMGANCTLVVTFDPSALQDGEAQYPMSVGYFNGQDNAQVKVTLHATVVKSALLQLADWSNCSNCNDGGNPYDFGTVGTATEHSFWLYNVGGTAATGIGAGTPTLGDGFSFKGGQYPGTGGSCATTLAAGDSCSIVVAFAPSGLSVGAHSSTLNVKYGASLLASRAMTATFTDKAFLEITDCDTCTGHWDRDFGSWGIATTRNFTVRNLGAAAATNLRAGTPALADGFSFAGGSFPGTGGNCGGSVLPGASCTIAVSFAPGALAPGPHQSTVAVAYDGGPAGAVATRSVLATAIQHALLVLSENGPEDCGDSCGPWWFPSTPVGGSSFGTLTLFNIGGQAATAIVQPSDPFSSGWFDWADHAGFPGTGGTCSAALLASLPAGSSCTLRIGFYPTSTTGPVFARPAFDYQDGSGGTRSAGRLIGGGGT